MMSRDRRYDSFKTWSGKLERQLAHLAGAGPEFPEEEEDGCDAISSHHTKSMPQVDRFFAALECPELDKLRSSEELVLPLDKTWPFLLRFPVSAFGICLGVSTQAILWKTVATSAPTRFLHVTTKVNLVLPAIKKRNALRVAGVPGDIKSASSLLYVADEECNLQGLLIIKKLTRNHDTCSKIGNAMYLIGGAHAVKKKPSSITIEFSRGNYNKILSCLFSTSDLEYLQIERCIMSLPREFEGFKQLIVLNLHTPNLSNVYVTLDKTKVADRSKNYMMQSFCQPN
ncbi:hypothetical protein OsJ_06994 [Oryza sativa Japonica Group]|uniref:Uncharacterized protein n=1 Tax=Oryza sativa subsp. japonica TaxID=39947 RepID=B9F0C5_ORYSJ|nr:hypothetical protein OsJ_06994 [Oryza sativa Japonica Group]